jgi:hypothetical protein
VSSARIEITAKIFMATIVDPDCGQKRLRLVQFQDGPGKHHDRIGGFPDPLKYEVRRVPALPAARPGRCAERLPHQGDVCAGENRPTSVSTGWSRVLAAVKLLDLDLFAQNSATIDVAADRPAGSGIKSACLDHAHGAVWESANDLG